MNTTAIIAAKDEAQSIAKVIEYTKQYVQEVIVVDGHSKDETANIAKSLGAIVVFDHKKGKGDALRVGVATATGDIIVFIDADCSHNESDIPKLVSPILSNEADMVIASRAHGGSDELSGNFNCVVRLIGSHIITQIINWRFGSSLSETQNGFRAIKKDKFLQLRLRENSQTIEQEMVMKALKLGFKIAEIPSHEYKRLHGKSHISLKTAWFSYMVSLVRGIF